MGKSSAPKPPPVPTKTKTSQASPFGTASAKSTMGGTEQKIELSPGIQAIFDPLQASSANLAGMLPQGQFSLSDVPQGMDLTNAFFNQQMGLLQPGFDEQLRDFEIRAAERGLPIGSEAFNSGLSPIMRSQNQAREQAANKAILLTPQEEQRQIANFLLERQLPFQEAGQSLGLLNQVPVPNFSPMPTDPNMLAQQGYQNQLGAYNQQQSGLSSLLGAVGTIGGAMIGGPTGASIGGAIGGGGGSIISGSGGAPYSGNPYSLPWL